MPVKINADEAVKHITLCFQSNLVPMLKGSPGIGKSDIFRQIAEKYKLKLIDIRLILIRSCTERANSRLKEDFGANNVMVKGHSKVTLHLMFGVVVLFADQLLRLAG